SESSTFVSLF
ncbi:putative siroheme synthase domain protein, partial [Vibrio parahaemolyticus V-223/04]